MAPLPSTAVLLRRRPAHGGARHPRRAGADRLCGARRDRQARAGRDRGGRGRHGPGGSTVGGIAKKRGCRAVGIAGGAEKRRILTDTFGFDAAVDHRAPDLPARLAAACPDGIDVSFENVGGAVWQAVLPLLNDFARVPVCRPVSGDNASALPEGPNRVPEVMRAVLSRRIAIRGFIVWDFPQHAEAFRREVGGWVADGSMERLEHRVEGLETRPPRWSTCWPAAAPARWWCGWRRTHRREAVAPPAAAR